MSDKQRVQDLAKEVYEYANSDLMNKKRALWTNHNSLDFTRPLVSVRLIPHTEIIADQMQCSDPYYRNFEAKLLDSKYRMKIKDDNIVEPYLVVPAAYKNIKEDGGFGVPVSLSEKTQVGGAAHFTPSIVEEEDIEKICSVDYEIDSDKSQEILQKALETFGDSIPIVQGKGGDLSRVWMRDISTPIAKMRGLEQLMWDIYDRPEWLMQLLERLQGIVIKHLDQAEKAGGFSVFSGENQVMPYCKELSPPKADNTAVKMNELWCFMASQEFTAIGPDDFKRFMFDFQKPIIERYGLSAYGCCEDMTQKISIIKELKNLRRISITPFSNLQKCAEQIAGDYVTSWRPNPSTAVAMGIDEDFIRKEMSEAFEVFDSCGCKFDITLKDNETVNNDKTTLIRWVDIVNDEINKRYGYN